MYNFYLRPGTHLVKATECGGTAVELCPFFFLNVYGRFAREPRATRILMYVQPYRRHHFVFRPWCGEKSPRGWFPTERRACRPCMLALKYICVCVCLFDLHLQIVDGEPVVLQLRKFIQVCQTSSLLCVVPTSSVRSAAHFPEKMRPSVCCLLPLFFSRTNYLSCLVQSRVGGAAVSKTGRRTLEAAEDKHVKNDAERYVHTYRR